jgi:hypothetical protein
MPSDWKGDTAASGSNSERQHLSAGTCGKSVGKPRQQEVMGESMGFSLGFGSNFAVWVLFSGLRVLSDSGGLQSFNLRGSGYRVWLGAL